jgi:hypothetical protein
VIFTFYATGVLVFLYMALFQITETRYFEEDTVVVPKHIIEETGRTQYLDGKPVEETEREISQESKESPKTKEGPILTAVHEV